MNANENAGKTVEQIAAELNPYRPEADRYEGWEQGFITGTEHAQQSQPMWREIEPMEHYLDTMILGKGRNPVACSSQLGGKLIELGYTHYLSSEELLKLPTENTKPTNNESI